MTRYAAVLVFVLATFQTAFSRPEATRRASSAAARVTGSKEHLQSVVAGGGGTMEIRLTPVYSHPTGHYNTDGYDDSNIDGQTLYVAEGGFNSFWNVQLLNWDPDGDGVPTLRSWQVRVSGQSYSNGQGTSLTPVSVPCANSANCLVGLGESGTGCAGGFCLSWWINRSRPDAFRTGDPKNCEPPLFTTLCGIAGCLGNPLFFGSNDPDRAAEDVYCSLADPHEVVYGGTLALHVPPGAAGTYTIAFIDNETFATDPGLNLFPPGIDVPGVLVVQGGACCRRVAGFNVECQEQATSIECDCTDCIWTADATCQQVDCLPSVGACCRRLDGFAYVCENEAGPLDCTCVDCEWTRDVTCGDVSCLPTPGACCDHGTADPQVSGCSEATIDLCQCEKCEWTAGATCLDVGCAPHFIPIPAASQWGLLVFTLALFIAAKLGFGRTACETEPCQSP